MVKKNIHLIAQIAAFVITPFSNATDPNFTIRTANATNQDYIYLFAHGLGSYQKQALDLYAHYKDYCTNPNYWIIDEPCILFDFPEAKTKEGEYYSKLVNLGQQSDMDRLELAYNEAVKQFPQKKIIFVGLSRGASVIINLICTKKLENIAAVILESPFDTLKSIIIHLIDRFRMQWIPYARQLGLKITEKHFPAIDVNGIFPMKVINKFPTEIPIIFIHSTKDKVIPINSSRKLYVKLTLAGHKDVYLLELKNGPHGKILATNEGEIYQNAIHAFYKKYGIPYNPQFASAGEILLLQPTVNDVMQRIANNKRTLEFEDDEEENISINNF